MPRGTHDCSKGRRLIAFIDYRGNAGRNCDLMSKKDNQSLRGQTLTTSRLPTGLPFRVTTSLKASHTRRASPLLAGCPLESLPARAIRLPDKEFRYLRQFYPSCRHEDWTISSSGGMSDVWPLRIPASLITGLSC